ncbi:hypothetical protein FACS1894219_11210 [Clostridia bacterium]|nr:hypothetical protein FACS1894219_11210 [Clostridia bacterium]
MNYGKNKKTPEERYKSLRKVSLLNIALNSALAAAKIAIGVFSGSNAVISDGINNFSDALTTVAVIVGLKLSSGEADRDHQYGHGRFESLVSVFLSLLLAATALLLGYSGVQKLLDGERVEPSVASIIVMAISIATKEVMYRYTYKKGRELKSTAVIADAWNYRSDSISSAAVLIGVAGGFFGAWFLEHIAALTVCVAILFAAAGIMREAVAGLTDRATSEFEGRMSVKSRQE